MLNKIHLGDCLEGMKKIPDNSIDSCVTDPPYGLSKEPNIKEVLTKWLNNEPYEHKYSGFMGKKWDSFVPHPDIWREVYRVLKPGAHALVFAGTRTQDLMTISLRLAGFEIRDVIEWLYFSGFPKSLDVAKEFDKRNGIWRGRAGKVISENGSMSAPNYERTPKGEPITDLAKKWDGWGTALKPAHEPIIMARKPLIGTVAENVERWGTGALNIDGCRIGESGARSNGSKPREDGYAKNNIYGKYRPMERIDYGKGRFPANCVTVEDDQFYSKYFNITPPELSKKASKKDRNSDWKGEDISIAERPARIYGEYQGTPDHATNKHTKRANFHPTVKPTDLMAWLIHLITPPGGIVLDPFAGSGSTIVAAKREGFNYIGFELEEEYYKIAQTRLGEDVLVEMK